MSFEPKKREDIENDKYNIKSHLNTSLETEGISVSEDLISRTMDAIRLQETTDINTTKDNLEHKKPIFLYRNVRTLITVAAAALILVIGVNAIRILVPIEMKGNMQNYDSAADDMGAKEMYTSEEAPKEDKVSYKMDTSDGLELDTKLTNGIDEDASDRALSGEPAADIYMANKADEELDARGDNDILASPEDLLTFEDITFIEATDVSVITISYIATDEVRNISNKEQLQDFYSVMKKHEFLQGMEDDTTAQYIVKLTSEDKDTQIVFGDTAITVDHTNKDITSHSLYITADQDILLKDLAELMVKE